MKKLLCIAVAMFIFMLSGCSSASSPENKDDYYEVNRTGVTEITGTAQMPDDVKKVVLTGDSVEKFLKQIDELSLQPTDADDNTKGWTYFFAIKYDDGSATSITLSEGKINIDGKIYKTSLYKANDFAAYFE